jgi:hypothetical protein
VRISNTNHSISDGIYTVDFSGCPEKLPRPEIHGRGNSLTGEAVCRETIG